MIIIIPLYYLSRFLIDENVCLLLSQFLYPLNFASYSLQAESPQTFAAGVSFLGTSFVVNFYIVRCFTAFELFNSEWQMLCLIL